MSWEPEIMFLSENLIDCHTFVQHKAGKKADEGERTVIKGKKNIVKHD